MGFFFGLGFVFGLVAFGVGLVPVGDGDRLVPAGDGDRLVRVGDGDRLVRVGDGDKLVRVGDGDKLLAEEPGYEHHRIDRSRAGSGPACHGAGWRPEITRLRHHRRRGAAAGPPPGHRPG